MPNDLNNKYKHFDAYLSELAQDIYPQPEDAGHRAWAEDAINRYYETAAKESTKNVLDIGCAAGFCKPLFAQVGLHDWTGVTRGEDYAIAKAVGLNVHEADMTFLPFPDNSFDLLFARHVLEHSPFPLITLMEWQRVSIKWLYLIAPAPEYWTYAGRNHYSMMNNVQIEWYLKRAGWFPIGIDTLKMNAEIYKEHNPEVTIPDPRHPPIVEYRYICHSTMQTVE
ncbi:hypothetical protein LCGC14_0508800 [marine sediment metagenome]|uniref:Methyltransferase type 11 domain-containing protein n=1 Tax=marine sediment metagenome TaxID=412755 RepID=A0A0F9UNL2_9ZZZZ